MLMSACRFEFTLMQDNGRLTADDRLTEGLARVLSLKSDGSWLDALTNMMQDDTLKLVSLFEWIPQRG